MDYTFKTIAEFNDYFKDELTCYEFLEEQRWNGVPVCPHCGSTKKPYKVKPRVSLLIRSVAKAAFKPDGTLPRAVIQGRKRRTPCLNPSRISTSFYNPDLNPGLI